jgi:Leucine-rich repeat (LRR) protein
MNRLIILCFLLMPVIPGFSQGQQKSADQLKAEMALIRRTTDWSNQTESKKAQATIEELSRQLMMIRQAEQQQQAGVAIDSAKLKEEVEYRMQLWHQLMEGVSQGEGGDILIAKPLREKIVEAYKNDESPRIMSPDFLEEQTYLCIDMSVPTIQRIIDQMDKFKSIKILLITCSRELNPVDLGELLERAKNYPLEQLHIINFRQQVSEIPSSIGNFESLQVLSLFNNNIGELPESVSQLLSLKKLYIDINPLTSLLPAARDLKNLVTLGIAETNISVSETEQLRALLPNCKILVQ